MAFYQVGGQLEVKDKRVKGIQKTYDNLPELPFLKDFFEKYQTAFHLKNPRENAKKSQAPCKPLRSQKQELEQSTDV